MSTRLVFRCSASGLAASQLDACRLRELALVYGAGWASVTATVLWSLLVGVIGLVLTVILLVAMLVLAFVITAPPAKPKTNGAADDDGFRCPEFGPLEQANLARIMNLTRVEASPRSAALLLSELDDALATEVLAGWSLLVELRDMLRANSRWLTPFGCPPNRAELEVAW